MAIRSKFLMLFSVLLTSLWSTPLLAAGNTWSLELLAGSADQEGVFCNLPDPACITGGDDTSLGLRLGYKLNTYFAAELSYHNYGTASQTYVSGGNTLRDDYDTTSVNLGVKGSLPLNYGFSLTARVGAAFVDSKVPTTDLTVGGSSSVGDEETDLYYGVGVEKTFGGRYVVGLEYTVFESDFDCAVCLGSNYELEVENISVMLGINF